MARKDEERAAPLLEVLRDQGIPVLRLDDFLDPGSDWQANQRKALQDAAAVLVVWSINSRQSDWVQKEANEASRADKLLPVTLDGMAAVPLPFGMYNTLDL